MSQKPCITLSGSGGVQVSAWKNRKGDKEWYSIQISRRYKREGSSEWQSTPYLGPRDLLVAALLCEELYKKIEIKEFGAGLAAPACSIEEESSESSEGHTDTPF